MEPDYIYNRKDGGTTYCYGEVLEDSNFSLVDDDEELDGIVADYTGPTSWHSVCVYLEKNYSTTVEQLESC